MKPNYFLLAAIIVSILIVQASCRKAGKEVSAISKKNGTDSHYNGADCATCHKQGGKGADAGWFVLSGSVYKPDQITANPNAIIHLFTDTHGGGTEVAKIEVDGKGNFYSTQSIDFGNGLYPAIESPQGTMQYMNNITRVGACNGCHGVSNNTGKLFCD